ncbi:MAB_1171c family putative transporter [Mycobacterium sp. E3247]|uniref:MAB_1171c family putative transporter n=1 Tax=Mycobacterium sp. E3247 TaxID=1856864 RepID=UPI0007FBF71D|nr:MAB_1171c family putative transporter [Mycobacterium sp. E3247]OBH15911.1 hypothetical protein A9X04_12590 [Mycobacterium sp. E3247]
MTATVPGIIAWSVITLMVIVLAARYRWCRSNLYDTYYNNLMAFVLLAQLLREHSVEVLVSRSALMTVTTAQQLGFAAMIFASTEFIGFTMLWTRLSPVETRRAHAYYRLAAVVLCLAYLAAATRARVAGQTLEVSGGWDAILAWSLYLTMIFVVAARVSWMFAAELRKSTRRREFLLAVGGLLLGVVTAVGCSEAVILALTDQLGWTSTLQWRLWFHGFEFFCIAVVVFILGTVPLAAGLLCYLGLDPTSRTWKRLEPLRLSMTTIVPESSFNLDHVHHRFQKTALQLHQTVIEIRDAILQLRPYCPDVPPHELARFLTAFSVPTRDRDAASHAFELAHAARAKIAGAARESPDTAPMARTRSTTLDEEAAQLLRLAKWWRPAYMATEHVSPMAPTK